MRQPRSLSRVALSSLKGAALATALLLSGAPRAFAGWYLSPAVKWATFAGRPEGEEPTPNFYGYGGALGAGFSVKQVMDLGAYGQYVPGQRKEAAFATDDASLVSYGGEIAFRFAEAVHVGLRGGASTYHLYKPKDDGNELPGEWHGPSGGLALGAVARVSKQSFVITTFEVMHHVVRAEKPEYGAGKRRFDSVAISLAYMFNSYESYGIENTIFKDFLDSTLFQ